MYKNYINSLIFFPFLSCEYTHLHLQPFILQTELAIILIETYYKFKFNTQTHRQGTGTYLGENNKREDEYFMYDLRLIKVGNGK